MKWVSHFTEPHPHPITTKNITTTPPPHPHHNPYPTVCAKDYLAHQQTYHHMPELKFWVKLSIDRMGISDMKKKTINHSWLFQIHRMCFRHVIRNNIWHGRLLLFFCSIVHYFIRLNKEKGTEYLLPGRRHSVVRQSHIVPFSSKDLIPVAMSCAFQVIGITYAMHCTSPIQHIAQYTYALGITHIAETTLSPFCRRRIQMHFIEWKFMNFG